MNAYTPVDPHAPLIVRLERPGDHSRCFSEQIEVQGWLLLPHSLAGQKDSLRVEILAEEHGGQSALRVGMAFCGESLGNDSSHAGLRLSSIELSSAPEQVVDPSGKVVGETISIQAVIDASQCRTSANSEYRAFSLALRAEVSQKRVLSNLHTVSIYSPEAGVVPLGELTTPNTTILSSELLLVEGWAVRHDDSLKDVEISLGELSFGNALINIKSPRQAAALPDIAGAEACRFSAVVSREQAEAAGLSAESLRCGVQLMVQCRFASGEVLQLGRPTLRWEAGPAEPHQARLETLAITPDGTLSIAGWVVNRYLEAPSWRLSWSRAELEFHGQEPGAALSFEKRRDIAARFPRYAGDENLGFRIQIDSRALGSRPLLPSFAMRGPFDDKYKTVEPSALLGGVLQLCRIESGKPTEPFPGSAALNASLSAGRNLVQAKRKERAARIKEGEAPLSRLLIASHNLSAMEGAPKVLGNLIRAIRKRLAPQLEIVLISPKDGPLRESLEELGIRVHIVEQLDVFQQHGERYIQGLRQVRKLISDFNPQVVLANVIDSFWAIDYAHRYGIPAAWVIHESIDPRAWLGTLDANLRQVFFHCFRHAARSIFVAERTAELYRPFLGAGGAAVIPNGIDYQAIDTYCASLSPEAARRELGLGQETVVSIVGTTTRRKGQDVFLRAMAELKERQPHRSFRFYIVGAREIPYLAELKMLSRELSLGTEVEFVPETPNITPYYRASDVLVIASREESAPLVSLEAFAFGVPLVSTTVFGLAEQIRPEENALAFAVDRPDELALGVERLLADAKLRERITSAARRDIVERFSLDASMERFWNELRALNRGLER